MASSIIFYLEGVKIIMGLLRAHPGTILGQKIAQEFCEYKRWMKKQTKQYILDHSYEIDSMISFYENLIELIRTLPEDYIVKAINQPNILRKCYEDWLQKEDNITQQQIDSIYETLSKLS